MKIIIAPDSFKGALRSPGVCEALMAGWLSRRSQDEVLLFPLADGGEGTCDALVKSTRGRTLLLEACDPLMRKVPVSCGIAGNGKTGIMELAAASGIELLAKDELDPLKSSTYGSGEVMKALLDAGCREFVMGIGGSATVDGGAGMLQALGCEFYNSRGELLAPGAGGGALKEIAKVSLEKLDSRIFESKIRVACDVTNPLLGSSGAAAVFGPQKGATPEMVDILEENLKHWAALWEGNPELPGSGAAGGVGFMLRTVLKAEITSGADLVIKYTGAAEALAGADLLITGEGCSDSQTACGKLPAVIAEIAKKENVPAILCSGGLQGDISSLYEIFDGVFSISHGAVSLEEAMEKTAENLRRFGANLAGIANAFAKQP